MFHNFKYITNPENALQAIFRFISTLIVKLIAPTPITPNQISIFRMIIVIYALYCFANGDPNSLLLGVILFYVFEILDHVDGDLARYKNLQSKLGPLIEQFIDTWSSRPSNIFGFAIAYGIFNETDSILGFILFALTSFGRLMWLEYRYYFGWTEHNKTVNQYTSIIADNLKESIINSFKILYIWNNTFLLIGCLLYSFSINIFGVSSLIVSFSIVALLNNLSWIYIVIYGFKKAINSDEKK